MINAELIIKKEKNEYVIQPRQYHKYCMKYDFVKEMVKNNKNAEIITARNFFTIP